MDTAEYRARVARDMSEKVLQERVRQLCLMFSWRYYHTHRSQHSPAGFPDTVAVRGPRLIFAELKRQAVRYKPSAEQQAWLNNLTHIADLLRQSQPIYDAPEIGVYLWRPMDLLDGTIEEALR